MCPLKSVRSQHFFFLSQMVCKQTTHFWRPLLIPAPYGNKEFLKTTLCVLSQYPCISLENTAESTPESTYRSELTYVPVCAIDMYFVEQVNC